MKLVIKKPNTLQWRGFTYHEQGDRLVCRTRGEHPPTPPGYQLERTVGKCVRGVITCHVITYKRSCGVGTARPPRLAAALPRQPQDAPLSHPTDGLYSQVPPELWPEVDHA